MAEHINVADRLAQAALRDPSGLAVVCPRRFSPRHETVVRKASGTSYAVVTFEELDADATRIARGLLKLGVEPGMRLVLLVPAGVEFVSLVFALLRSGVTAVLIDPGLGRKHLLNCLAAVEPDGFVAIAKAQMVRALLAWRFSRARFNVTVGRRWFGRGPTLETVRRLGTESQTPLPRSVADDPAAIIFTSGSTGPPKGVLYTHRMFDTQAAEIESVYRLEKGGVDLACFPLFGLFNSAMGVTTIFPEMDFSRPASAEPARLLAAANDWEVTQSFASPAVWKKLSQYCASNGQRIGSLRQIFSCGAPVPADVLRDTLALASDSAQMHTPYGATECLPVATIEAQEVLGETERLTNQGKGICVGRKFASVEWKIIQITDGPIRELADANELPSGMIGELIVRGPQASPAYVTGVDANRTGKILDGETCWHRMGDVGYLDQQNRFWYCGRKAHRVVTEQETLYTIPVEAIFNQHEAVQRSALVGVGSASRQTPVLVVERCHGANHANWDHQLRELGQSFETTQGIDTLLVHPGLPVDIRHNAKINRERLAQWASRRLASD